MNSELKLIPKNSDKKRKSHLDQGEIYFWTATIHKWKPLLHKDEYKQIILDSLQFLSDAGKIDVFAFVIMPTHIHVIWRIIELNGKESPHGSFLKFTAHIFQKKLRLENKNWLPAFAVKASNKKYEFWQRDSLAVRLFSRKVALQKLNYIHKNPLAKHWTLAIDPCSYHYSSALYYVTRKKEFPFLKYLWDEM